MKLLRVIIILLFSNSVYCQISEDCLINPRIYSASGCNFRLEQLKQVDIDKYKMYCSYNESYNLTEFKDINNSDSLELNLFKVYPLNFNKIESGFEFKNYAGKKIKIQKSGPNVDMKEFSDYNIISKTHNFIVISQTGYESWSYLLIDLDNFISYNLPSKPIFINSNLIYGFTNYYGSGEITFINMKNKTEITLSFEHEITSVSYSRNLSMGTLLEFRKEKCNSEKYLSIIVN